MMTMTPSMTSMATAAATTIANSTTGGGHMNMGGDDCKIAMLWNWNVIDACFVTHSWRITSAAMFAGSCIGVILLVLLLEFLRRAGKEYDAYILRSYQHNLAMASSPMTCSNSSTLDGHGGNNEMPRKKSFSKSSSKAATTFRPTLVQQMIRAGFHTLAFAVGYILMLLAMYYNGYIIMCIFIGAYIGFFVFGWEAVELSGNNGPSDDATNCCG
ncbi:hypothetical protein BLS_008379 [Venturia inaequalis]|uniref:Copper transport protein n=1 Tax=Venturia inaequalis TaxID=5025 RepID=A0A8H3YNX9_VENIN|nr:hypothetical protein BLS_008379 [Venturia inaequalis]KAE9972377.1 hypothetical protein EG328_005069 [Venturia inaequalis]KAE9974823.1 hypothetical protein EG327_008646 [Venturia inaequalis]